jgi:enoyl-CoA hydratase/carnithine racemase
MPELSTDLLDVSRLDDAVWQLRLDRPDRRNALSTQLRNDMSDALDGLAQEESLSVLVVTGTGPVFSAGFDLKEFDRAAEDAAFETALWDSSNRWHDTVRRFPLPTIASLNGPALAGGFDLATMCDLRIAARSAYLARPEVEWSMALYSIVHDLVGGALARELSFTNRRLDADEALRFGLVNRVVDDEQLAAATLDFARQVARAPRASLAATKAKAIACEAVAADADLAW